MAVGLESNVDLDLEILEKNCTTRKLRIRAVASYREVRGLAGDNADRLLDVRSRVHEGAALRPAGVADGVPPPPQLEECRVECVVRPLRRRWGLRRIPPEERARLDRRRPHSRVRVSAGQIHRPTDLFGSSAQRHEQSDLGPSQHVAERQVQDRPAGDDDRHAAWFQSLAERRIRLQAVEEQAELAGRDGLLPFGWMRPSGVDHDVWNFPELVQQGQDGAVGRRPVVVSEEFKRGILRGWRRGSAERRRKGEVLVRYESPPGSRKGRNLDRVLPQLHEVSVWRIADPLLRDIEVIGAERPVPERELRAETPDRSPHWPGPRPAGEGEVEQVSLLGIHRQEAAPHERGVEQRPRRTWSEAAGIPSSAGVSEDPEILHHLGEIPEERRGGEVRRREGDDGRRWAKDEDADEELQEAVAVTR